MERLGREQLRERLQAALRAGVDLLAGLDADAAGRGGEEFVAIGETYRQIEVLGPWIAWAGAHTDAELADEWAAYSRLLTALRPALARFEERCRRRQSELAAVCRHLAGVRAWAEGTRAMIP